VVLGKKTQKRISRRATNNNDFIYYTGRKNMLSPRKRLALLVEAPLANSPFGYQEPHVI
jgi:hypothetical protein